MKQSKTPLYKKSCLAGSLNYDNMIEWLEEIGENGDMYGYEDSSIEGYYNDYKEQFDELSGGAGLEAFRRWTEEKTKGAV